MKKEWFLILLCMFIFTSVVDADNDFETGSDSKVFISGSSGEFTGNISNGLLGYRGVRIKIVDKNGFQLSNSRVLNVQFDETIEKGNIHHLTNGSKFIMYGDGTCSKVDYANNGYNGCNLDNETRSSVDKRSIMNVSSFLAISGDLHYSSNTTDFSYKSRDFNMSKLFTNFTESSYLSNHPGKTSADYQKEVVEIILDLFQLDKDYWNRHIEEFKYGTYIIIEPTMGVAINGVHYWGTAYELAKKLNYKGKTDLEYLFNYLAPCSSVLTGGSIASNELAEGVDRNNHTYFGKLKYFSGSDENILNGCNASGLDDLYVTGDDYYGVSTKLLWLGEVFKEPTCEVIKPYYEKSKNKDLNTVIYTYGVKKYTVNDYMSSCDCDVVDNAYRNYMQTKYEECRTLHWNPAFPWADTNFWCQKYEIAMHTSLKNMDRWQLKNLFDSNTINDAIVIYNGSFNPISEWTYERYVKECPPNNTIPPTPTDKKGPDCTPKFTGIQKGNPGSCYTGQITYKESSEWEDCIFNDNGHYTTKDDQHNVSKDSANLTYYDDAIGDSSYCKVYCTEELNTSFEAYFPTVEAGRRFNWEGHSISGSRTCKTKTIEYDKFVKELDSANQDVVDAWARYLLEVKLSNVSWKQSAIKDCDWECTKYEQVPKCNEKGICIKVNGKCLDGYYKDYNYTPSSTYESASASGGKYASNQNKSLSTTCGGPGYTANKENYLKKYYDEVDNANGLVQNMKSCYNEGDNANWTNYNHLYNVNPKVTITYSGDAKYGYSGTLISEPAYTSVSQELDCVTDYQKLVTKCSGTTCTVETRTMKKCKSVKMTQGATVSFELDGNVYRYVNKISGESFHASQLGNHSDENYINIGQGNFPVSFATNPGDYDGLKLTYSNLGHLKNGQSKIDKIVQSLQKDTGTPYGTFQCGYTVTRGIVENPNDRGKIVIYRPIDLYDPFPSIDGDGRNTGWNWGDQYGTSNKNQTVQRVILNNRNVKGDEVYNLTPMYSFTLTPSLIKSIREHNRNNVYDNESLDCDKNTGGRCISNYLTELIQLTGATGTCTQDRKGTFDTCRY